MTGERYAITSLLHQLKNRRVYSATCKETGKPVIMKVLSAGGGPKERFEERQRLFDFFIKFHHPNVISLLEAVADSSGRNYYLVMERAEGETLRQYVEMNQQDLTVGGFLDILRGVAAGIDALHREGVVHRDIKPDNVFVSSKPRVPRIVDLDSAMGLQQVEETGVPDPSGTPAFIAPEQIIGANFGPPADIYAFAMSIYVLMARNIAFEAKTCRELLYAHVHSTPIPLCLRNNNWPLAVQAVMEKSMSKKPEKRHASATQLVAEMQNALQAFTPFRISSYFDGSLSRFNSGEIPINF